MATFRVGQSIKKVSGTVNIGCVAEVVAMSVSGYAPGTIEVKFSTPWVNAFGDLQPAGNTAYTSQDHWEPLTDANDLVSWESMRDLWVPEQYRVVA